MSVLSVARTGPMDVLVFATWLKEQYHNATTKEFAEQVFEVMG